MSAAAIAAFVIAIGVAAFAPLSVFTVVAAAGVMVAAKLLLNVQCPGWEAEAPDLALLIASKVPPGCAWVGQPLGEVSCR